MVAATDRERAGDQSRDSGPVFALGKTGHFDYRHVEEGAAAKPAISITGKHAGEEESKPAISIAGIGAGRRNYCEPLAERLPPRSR